NGQADHHCVLLDARILDEPVVDLVLSRCEFTRHADAVLAEMESEYQAGHDEVRRRNRERTRLLQDVETLKANLAITKKPVDVTVVWRSGAQQHLWVERPRLARGRKTPWSVLEDERLRTYYPASTSDEIQAQFPERAYSAIQARASTLGIRRQISAIQRSRG